MKKHTVSTSINLFLILISFISCTDKVNSKNPEIATTHDTLLLNFATDEFDGIELELALNSPFLTLPKLKSKRIFEKYCFNADSSYNNHLIKKLENKINHIKSENDTVNGVQIFWDKNTSFIYFIKSYKLCSHERPNCIMLTISEGMFAWYMENKL